MQTLNATLFRYHRLDQIEGHIIQDIQNLFYVIYGK